MHLVVAPGAAGVSQYYYLVLVTQASMSQRLLQYWSVRIKAFDQMSRCASACSASGRPCVRGKRNLGGRIAVAEQRARAPESVRLHRMGSRLIVAAARPLADEYSVTHAALEKKQWACCLRMHGVICHLTTRLHRTSPWYSPAAALPLASHQWCHSAPSAAVRAAATL